MTAMLGHLRRWVARRVALSFSHPVDATAVRCICTRFHSLYLRPGYPAQPPTRDEREEVRQ